MVMDFGLFYGWQAVTTAVKAAKSSNMESQTVDWNLMMLQKEEIFEQLNQSYIAGITFSGGDPLYWGNVADVTELAKEIKEKYPKKTIWLYTGSLWERIQEWIFCSILMCWWTESLWKRKKMFL